MTRRFGQDIAAGLMFIGFGALGLYLARNYPVGTALRMEPGYVPRLLCWGMVGVGAIIAARGLFAGDSPIARWHWRPVLFVLGGLIGFRYLIEPVGLVAACFVIVVLGAYGSREVKLKDSLLLAAGLAAGSVALFVYALGLPMRVWPEWSAISAKLLGYGLLALSVVLMVLHLSGAIVRVVARFPLGALAALLALAGVVVLVLGA